MTMIYGGSSERKLIPEARYKATIKHEGKVLGNDFNNPGKKKVQLRVIVQFDGKTEQGDRHLEKWLYFTPSLHEKSSLRAFLTEWRGKDFTKDQLDSFKKQPFDMSRLVGTVCAVKIVHKTAENGDVKDTIRVVDQLGNGDFRAEWYEDQRDKFARDTQEAEEYEAAQRGHKEAAFDPSAPRDEDDTTDYSEEHHG